MANSLYTAARAAFLQGQIDWVTDTIKVALVDTDGYTVNLDVHTHYDAVAPYQVNTAQSLASKTVSAEGAAAAANVTFSSVQAIGGGTGAIEAIVIYKEVNPADNTQNPLIAYIDTATGLPITPNGGDIIVTWDTGINKIFRL
jgi:hypothetical protein